MKITVLLRHNHEVLRDLIDKFRNTPTRKQDDQAIVQEIRKQVQMHSEMASEAFYPALAASPSDRAAQLVATARKRCDVVEKLFQELSRLKPSDAAFEVKMNTAIAEIARHIEMEEDELFHEARKTFPEYRLEELGLETQDRRKRLNTLAAI
jgi:hemerythrin HHE cation binding domain-containing protein